jgi:hypothetical protein
MIVSEDFEKLDLAKLPQGWWLEEPGDISIADDPAKGKVLRINHKGNGNPGLVIKLDIDKVRGRTIRVSALGKCPGMYIAAPERRGGPQLQIICQNKGGAANLAYSLMPPTFPDWVTPSISWNVPADAEAVTVSVRVVFVAADVYFDSLRVEAMGDPVAPPAGGAGAPPAQGVPNATPGNPAAGKPNVPAAPVPTGAAASAPLKGLDEDGIIFSPEIAAAVRAERKAGATARSFAVVGPGAPIRELEGKGVEKWKGVPSPRELAGALAQPESLTASLPSFVAANKPEVVIVVGDTSGARKLSFNERFDWEDLARICLRFGAVPVLAVPPAGANDELRREMVEAAKLAGCPVMDLKNPAALGARAKLAFDLVERHVFERGGIGPAAKSGAKEPATDE